MDVICQACTGTISMDDRYCMHCGIDQNTREDPPLASMAIPLSSVFEINEVRCVACTQLIPNDDSFCMHCGVKQKAQQDILSIPIEKPITAPLDLIPKSNAITQTFQKYAPTIVKQKSPVPKLLALQNDCVGCKKSILALDFFCPACGVPQNELAAQLAVNSSDVKKSQFKNEDSSEYHIECSDTDGDEHSIHEDKIEILSDLSLPKVESFDNPYEEHEPEQLLIETNKSEERVIEWQAELALMEEAEGVAEYPPHVNCKKCGVMLPEFSRFCILCGTVQFEIKLHRETSQLIEEVELDSKTESELIKEDTEIQVVEYENIKSESITADDSLHDISQDEGITFSTNLEYNDGKIEPHILHVTEEPFSIDRIRAMQREANAKLSLMESDKDWSKNILRK
jgi:hypothetical protein